ncbi:DNA replication protein DnaC [Desulfitobacterium sp. LBE]|uniref:IS21-like element helper ATPase IstB n=1 Tax=Desulfitobacterium sp. LBE TaxID=884086 RepID=UPI00119A3775|nr:IS21-like element helper ATPase IstB [Desulfitobacterium sp. LBE]TWH55847.1 DNA replication protein DnaC [Desulfitobacterium sp. LBE]TWH59158.1 DNA replication protein DnaC [Desulfitobacterium sp. LBE]TWH60046.1 DNA replication protein DnaC [Desulfitobacterium sp. LBE]
MIYPTLEKLATLRLSAMEQEYRRQLELPAMSELSFDDRMAMLVDAEWLARFNKKLKRLIKAAHLREPKACLEDLDFHPARQLDKGKVARLSDGKWIREGRNLLITGSCGTGKTYLASALGNAACRQGLKVRSFRVTRLLTDLQIGRGDGSWNRLMAEMKKPDLLILDDFGISPLGALHCRDFLEVIDDRYGSKSTLITAQVPVSEWHGLFEDATIADAVLDRLVHNAYRFELQGPSKRRALPEGVAAETL